MYFFGIIDFAEKVVAGLDVDNSFLGKCFVSWMGNREKRKIFLRND